MKKIIKLKSDDSKMFEELAPPVVADSLDVNDC